MSYKATSLFICRGRNNLSQRADNSKRKEKKMYLFVRQYTRFVIGYTNLSTRKLQSLIEITQNEIYSHYEGLVHHEFIKASRNTMNIFSLSFLMNGSYSRYETYSLCPTILFFSTSQNKHYGMQLHFCAEIWKHPRDKNSVLKTTVKIKL